MINNINKELYLLYTESASGKGFITETRKYDIWDKMSEFHLRIQPHYAWSYQLIYTCQHHLFILTLWLPEDMPSLDEDW